MSEIGRNEPCPCGSGEKYKRCCLNNEELLSEADNPATALLAELRTRMLLSFILLEDIGSQMLVLVRSVLIGI
jgi:uncharacterized protein YchJ